MTLSDAQWKAANAAKWGGRAGLVRAFGLPEPERVQRVVAALACAPGSTLLDAGCGAGRWSIALAKEGYRVRGIDVSPQMIAEARELAHELGVEPGAVEFDVGDVDHVHADDASYDGIICTNVLDFLPSPAAGLTEFRRLLKPGRRLFLSVLGAYSPPKRESWRRFLPQNSDLPPSNHILPWEAEGLLEALGWRIVEQRPDLGPSYAGLTNRYTPEMVERLGDRVLQQTVASFWEFVAVKSDNGR